MAAELFSNVYIGLVVVAFFGVTIFIHELGHYLVARWCGLTVKVFAIGFGPALWKKEVNGIQYKIGCIPFGGYVALPQLDPTAMQTVQGGGEASAAGDEEKDDGEKEAVLEPVAPWKKILVSLAGATGNVLLAIILAWIVYWVGMPATMVNQDTVLGYVEKGTALYEQGVRIGDRITRVNGAPVDQWSHFIQEAAMYDEVTLDVVQQDGAVVKVKSPTETWRYGIRTILGIEPRAPVTVGKVDARLSAAAAGVQSGDVILSFGGQEVLSQAHLIEQVAANRDQAVDMKVMRRINGKDTELALNVTPVYDPEAAMTRIGIRFMAPVQAMDSNARVHPLPMTQIKHQASGILRFLRDLVTPKKSARAANMVGGPVAIITSYVDMIRASFMLAVWFTGFLNINLAIINLLPLPVLDGGHIVFSLWEWVFRRPLHARIINLLVNAFAFLLIGLFLVLSFRDVDRHTPVGGWVRGLFGTNTTELVVAPEAVGVPAAAPEGTGEGAPTE
ncbi:MAG TPA: RIP metalloprotease RseP [Verrucomicrobia bacterium]|nr:RIP metalloprotease RseP [Verrucomicrobiota bacterium]